MKIVLAIEASQDGTQTREIPVPNGSEISFNKPRAGWTEVNTPDGTRFWLQDTYLVGFLPDDA